MNTAIVPSSTPIRRWPRKTAGAAAAFVLVAGLTLTGCATTAASTNAPEISATASASESTDTSSGTETSTEARTESSTEASTESSTETAVTTDATTTSETITSTAAAATAFLATLSAEQVSAVTYEFDDETKTTSWSNFPVTFVERAGLNLADLSDEQQAAALLVLESLLSDEAYATVEGIMAGDQYLVENSSTTEDSLGQYYIAFFGDPSDTSAWEVQFGGHHLGINATLDGAEAAITFAPTHLGVQPAAYTDDSGTEVQAFAAIYEDAFAFYDSLTADQQARLYRGESVAALECEPGGTCDYPAVTGLSAADLTDEQTQLLLQLIANWAGMSDEETTAAALAEIEATLTDTTVAWTGATVYDMTTGDGIGFQISGPRVYIGFAAQQGSAGADVDGVVTSGWGHVHTIYRDPANDYANSVTQQESSGIGGGGTGGPGGGAPGGAPAN